MCEFLTVTKVGEIPEGSAAAYQVNGRTVAVFNDGGQYFAIDDVCPHTGGSLSSGDLKEGVVTCPWHGWRFRIRDGTWCDNPRMKIDSFEVRVRGDEIQVRVPANKAPQPDRGDDG